MGSESFHRLALLAALKKSPALVSTPWLLPLPTMESIKVISLGKVSFLSREKSLCFSFKEEGIFFGIMLRIF